MTTFSSDRDATKTIDWSGGVIRRRFITLLVSAFLLILLFNSVVRVSTGHVAVVTLFDRVTGEVLPEGMHLLNPL